MGTSKSAAKRIIAAERAEKILELRKAGATYLQCGRAAGVGEARAYQVCSARMKEINKRCTEDAEEMRELESQRLQALLLKLEPAMRAGDVQAIAEARKIGESKRKLFGIDAPTKQEVTGAGGAPCVIEVVYEKAK